MITRALPVKFILPGLLAVSLLASSCQHSPRKNFVLLNAPSTASQKNSSVAITQVIGIGPVEVADYLDRTALVYTQADNNLEVSSNDYWGEPLTKGIARVLADNLMQRDNSRSFIQFPWRSDSKPDISIRVNIHSLNRKANDASLDCTWELVNNLTKTVLQRQHYSRTRSASAGPAGTAQAYSQLLGELAAEMDKFLLQSVNTANH